MSNPGTPEPQPTAQQQADADERLQQRYGRGTTHLGQRAGSPRISRRNIIIVVVVTAIAAMATWFIIDAQRDSFQAEVRSWESPADGVMPVSVEVDRSPDTVLTCELIAVDIRHIVVGQLEFEIPAGEPARQRVEADIPLRGDAIAPELIGCSRDG